VSARNQASARLRRASLASGHGQGATLGCGSAAGSPPRRWSCAKGEIVPITAHRMMTGSDISIKERLPMLAPPLAALLYPFALEGFPHQRRAHRGGRFYPTVAERRGVPCPGLRDAADRYACCDVLLRDRPANCGAIARKAHGPACPRGPDLVRLRRRRSHHAARSGARHLALDRMLGDRARAAVALRQQRAGGARGPVSFRRRCASLTACRHSPSS
jgi:hypothetical protein